jgi:hypothetical protein
VSSVIPTSVSTVVRVCPDGPEAGATLTPGLYDSQAVTVVNLSSADGATLTFAEQALSHVARGPDVVLHPLSQTTFVWDLATLLWYAPAAPPAAVVPPEPPEPEPEPPVEGDLHEDLKNPPPAGDLASLRNAIRGTASGQTCTVPDGIYRIGGNDPIHIPGGVRVFNARKRAWFFLSRNWAAGGEAGTTWTQTGAAWTSSRAVPELGTNEPGGVSYTDQARALRYEMCVGIKLSGDVVRFESIAAGGTPNTTQFCFVSASDRRIRLGANPADFARIEVVETPASTARWFWPDGDGVTLEGLVFRYCPSGPSADPAGSHDRHNFSMRQCVIGDVHGCAVNYGGSNSATFEDNLVEYFGGTGLSTYNIDGLKTNRNQIYHGGYGGWDNLWQGGATKFTVTRNHECNDNIMANGQGSGLWWDESCAGPINVHGNLIYHWAGPPFHFEISSGPIYVGTVRGNCFAYNLYAPGWPTVYVSSSAGPGEIANNLIVAAAGTRGLQVYWAQDRSNDKTPTNWYWHHNRYVAEGNDAAVFVGGGAEDATLNNRGASEQYYFAVSPQWQAGAVYTSINSWNGTPFDDGGVLVDKATADDWLAEWGLLLSTSAAKLSFWDWLWQCLKHLLHK